MDCFVGYTSSQRRDRQISLSSHFKVIAVYEHKCSIIPGFTKKYGCKLLVYYEIIESMETAITREKKIKGGSRKNKIKLIETQNPTWLDLYENICG